MKRVVVVILASFLGACSPSLYLESPVPPNRVARLDDPSDKLEMTEGVAVAMGCSRAGGMCNEVSASTDDPRIARVLPAHFARVEHGFRGGYGMEWTSGTSALAVVGIAPGSTKLRVVTEGHARTYDVTVVPVPQKTDR